MNLYSFMLIFKDVILILIFIASFKTKAGISSIQSIETRLKSKLCINLFISNPTQSQIDIHLAKAKINHIESSYTPYSNWSWPTIFNHYKMMNDKDFLFNIKPSIEEPNISIKKEVESGKSFESLFKNNWPLPIELQKYFNTNGEINLHSFPKFSFSLENGRQKLDFVRIHFSKLNSNLAIAVLKDYLSAAEKIADLKILIVTDQSKEILNNYLKNISSDILKRIKIVEIKSELWIWSQDGSKPVDFKDTTLTFDSERYEKSNIETEQNSTLTFLKALPFQLEGGDFIIGDTNIFVGHKIVKRLSKRFLISDEKSVEILTYVFQKKVIVFEAIDQNLYRDEWKFHIDLDLVLAINKFNQKEEALINDPEYLLSYLSGIKISEDPNVEEILKIKEKILNNAINGYFSINLHQGNRNFIRVLGNTKTNQILDFILIARNQRKILESYGYKVHSMPSFGKVSAGVSTTNNKSSTDQTFFFGTNSILSDTYALVPNNDFPILDKLIQEIYSQIGYEVIPMKSSALTITRSGGIRCSTETFRKPYVPIKRP